jgi:hypothetical protein
MPLGASPFGDQDPADGELPIGYPLMNVYLKGSTIKKLCTMQVLVEGSQGTSNELAGSYYVNMSGVLCKMSQMDLAELNTTYTLLNTMMAQAAGDPDATAAMTETIKEADAPYGGIADGGAGLGAIATTNAYAGVLWYLREQQNNATLVFPVGETYKDTLELVLLNYAGDPTGLTLLYAALDTKVTEAVWEVHPYFAADTPCTGYTSAPAQYIDVITTALDDAAYYRTVADLYAVLMISQVESEFHIVMEYAGNAAGDVTLPVTDLTATGLGMYRLSLSADSVMEIKAWQALFLTIWGFNAQLVPISTYYNDTSVGTYYRSCYGDASGDGGTCPSS